MHLTPAILEAAYTYLRATPPFNKWKLPESGVVEFYVVKAEHAGRHTYGFYKDFPEKWIHRIELSFSECETTKDIVETMAHEMVHLHQFANARRDRTPADHGPKFNRLAAQVCRQHGFDLKTF